MRPGRSNRLFSVPWNWNTVRIALLHDRCHASCRRQQATHNADSTLCTFCPDGFARIDDPLQLGSRNSHILEYIRHSRIVQRMKAQLSMQGKKAREHVKSENICAVEACGAKW